MATRYPLVPSVFFKNIVAMPRRLLYPPPSVDLCAPYGPIMCFREWGKTGRHDPSGMSGGALARRARSVDESCASSQCKLQRRRYRQPHPDFTSLKEPVRPQPSQGSSTDLPHMCDTRGSDHMVAVSGAAKVIRRDDELLCRPIARALLAQTRPDAAAHRSTI